MISRYLKKKKKENGFETLIQTIVIYNQDMGMEFGIEVYAIVIMKNETTEAIVYHDSTK